MGTAVRNSKEFHAGNITFLENIKPKNAEKHRKELSTVDHTIVINSGCPPHANRNISNEIKNTKKSFYLINTHGHHDHIMGNLVFRNAGSSIIAHINAREEMASLEDFDSSGLPNITFRDKMSLFVDESPATDTPSFGPYKWRFSHLDTKARYTLHGRYFYDGKLSFNRPEKRNNSRPN